MTGPGRPDVKRSVAGPAPGSVPCPECGEPIEISLDALVSRVAFHCRKAGCRTILRLDRRNSAEALEKAREVRERLDRIGRSG